MAGPRQEQKSEISNIKAREAVAAGEFATVDNVLAEILNDGYGSKCANVVDGVKVCDFSKTMSLILYYEACNHLKKHKVLEFDGMPDRSIARREVFTRLLEQGFHVICFTNMPISAYSALSLEDKQFFADKNFITDSGSVLSSTEKQWERRYIPNFQIKHLITQESPAVVADTKQATTTGCQFSIISTLEIEKVTRLNAFINSILSACLWFVNDPTSQMSKGNISSLFSADHLSSAKEVYKNLGEIKYKSLIPIDKKIDEVVEIIISYRAELLAKESKRYLRALDNHLLATIMPDICPTDLKIRRKLPLAIRKSYQPILVTRLQKHIENYVQPPQLASLKRLQLSTPAATGT